MPSLPSNHDNLLCPKGLAKRQGLVTFIGRRGVPATEDVGAADTRETLLLCHADGVIREVFNARYSDLNLVDASSRDSELVKRSELLGLLYRLYRASLNQTPVEVRRQLRASEVEAVISAVRRLSFMGSPTADALVAYCEQCAAADDDVLAHVMDPFQLRYLLTFHLQSTREQIGMDSVAALSTAAQANNGAAVRIWFQDLVRNNDFLPKDTPQLLRAVLLELWKRGEGDLGTLAFEITVLDVLLFDDLGWESTRAFCTQLRRVTGPGCDALDAYLTEDDVADALKISEELHQDDLVVHFRKLAKTHNIKHHRDLRKRVLVAAGKPADSVSTPPLPVPTKPAAPRSRPQSASRPSGWSTAAS